MQSLVPLAAPSGRPQNRLAAGAATSPLLHENSGGAGTYPHVVPTVDTTGRGDKDDSAPGPMRVLFVCTHNSARSQMAEGMLRAWGGDRFEAASAGTEATAVRPEAIAAMAELGIDIRGQTSKTIERYLRVELDWLVTVCDQARESCPTLPGVRRQAHWDVEDPSGATGSDEARLAAFRVARDVLADHVRELIATADRSPHD
jgi:arsenate reductase (thioredoxin)